MNRIKYEILIRSSIKDLFEICLGQEVPIEIVNYPTISAPRIFLEYILTAYSKPIPYPIVSKIDRILQWELRRKQLLLPKFIPHLTANPFISFCHYDITLIVADCIVNIFDPADSTGSGCLKPGHKCLDNYIHKKAGPQVRFECEGQLANHLIEPGEMFVTLGFNLPCRYIFHAMAPLYTDDPLNAKFNNDILASLYLNCLEKMREKCLRTIVFPCLPTGEYIYPKAMSPAIAIETVDKWLKKEQYICQVIFCMRCEEDLSLYEHSAMVYFNNF
jgi:O-acetyl-ADP-ribose deacetylase (regulator of RNase III)